MFHPWTSFVIVPLFAVANAGIAIDAELPARGRPRSPITIGIVVGYVVGKPLGIVGAPWLAVKLDRGRLQPPVGWPALAGGGAIAGIGFTVALLIAGLAFQGERAGGGEGRRARRRRLRRRCLLAGVPDRRDAAGRAAGLAAGGHRRVADRPVVAGRRARPHPRAPDAPVTLVEYGDFECPFCGQAETVIRDLLAEFGDDLRYVWRHLPLADVHPRAQLASEAAEAAAAQGAFWPMYDVLLAHQDELRPNELVDHARKLGLDTDRFTDDLRRHVYAARIAEDVDDADRSGVSGTPTFFVNGQRHHGAYDVATLAAAVRAARKRALAARVAAVPRQV